MSPGEGEPWHSSAGVAQLRTLYGHSTEFWAANGVVVDDSRWMATSGAASAMFNEALCHGPSGGDQLAPTVDAINANRVPATLSVAGEALRDVQRLVSVGWTCVECQPFMARRIDDLAVESGVRRLVAADLPVARQLIEDAFALPTDLSRFALPDDVVATPGHAGWGLFDGEVMVSCLGTAVVEDAAVIWSMATPARYRRRGYAARLLGGALAGARDEGATMSLLRSSAAGEPLYRGLGFELLEWWQVWSRPRWVLARD